MKRCLAKLHAQLRDFNTSDVKDAAEVYRSRGVEDKAANVRAIEDHLRDLRQQREQLRDKVRKAWKERDPEGYANAQSAAPATGNQTEELRLTGETEAEIRAREERDRAQSEQDRKRESTPGAESFTLTGSNRQADEAEARGQKPMFARTIDGTSGDKDGFWQKLERGEYERSGGGGSDPAGLRKRIAAAYGLEDRSGWRTGSTSWISDRGGEEALFWTGSVAGFTGYYTVAQWDGGTLHMQVVPLVTAKSASIQDVYANANDWSILTISLVDRGDKYELAVSDPSPGTSGYKALEAAARLKATGRTTDDGSHKYNNVVLDYNDDGARALVSEAIRRVGVGTGKAPRVFAPRRDTGANPTRVRDFSPEIVKAKFRRGADYGLGVTEKEFHSALGAAFGEKAAAKMAEQLELVPTQEALPAGVKRWMRDGDIVHGVALDGRAYIVLENVSPKMVRGLVLHELGVHVGMEKMLGADLYAKVMKRLDAMARAGNKSVIKARELAEQESPDHVAEETLAYLVQRNPEMGVVRQVIAAIKAYLFREFGIGGSMLSVDDLATLAKTAALKAGDAPAVSTLEDPAWHRAADTMSETLSPPIEKTVGIQPPARSGDGWATNRAEIPLFSRSKPEWAKGNKALESATGKVDTYAPTKSFREKFQSLKENWADRAVREVFDPYVALKKLTPNGYILARMVKSADTSLEATLRFGVPVMNDDGSISGKLDAKGFLGRMSELNGEHDRFFMWVAGNRSERLMTEDREHLFDASEVRAMKELSAGKMDDGTPRPQAYSKALAALNTYNRAFMDIAEKSGTINAESRKLWEHDFYVPFFRVDEDMKISGPSKVKGLVRNEILKKLKGGTEPLGDLLDNTIRNWQHVLAASLANQAAKTALKAAVDAGVAVEANEATAKALEKEGGPTAGATYVMDEGEKHWYTVGDPFVLEAISSLETPSINWIGMDLLRGAKRVLTTGVTVSPTFRVRNLMRDTSSIVAQNEISYNIFKNIYQGFKATSTESPLYMQAMFGGGIIRFGNIHDGKHAEYAKQLILDGVKEETILDTPTKVRAALAKSWDWYQENGDRFENTNRMALVQQRLEAGDSNLEAMFAGRDSMDFTLMGANKAVRFFAQTVPFLNARLQGLYKTGRSGVANPKRMAYVVGALTMASIALMLAYRDDDEWKKRADWDRDTYFWFKIGGVAFRIPKGFEFGGLASLVERGLEYFISDEMNGKRFAERLWFFVGNTLSLNPIPQLAKPVVDLYANTDSFTGREIETFGMRQKSKPERTGRRTSTVAKVLGKAGNVTQLSPAQIDHLIQAYFGWAGTHIAMTVDVMREPFLDVPKPARKLDEIFVVGDFIKSLPSNQSRFVDDFYKQAKKIHEVMGDLKQARETRDADKVRQILEDNRDEVGLKSMYANAQRTMTDINNKIARIERSSMGSDEKRDRIDELYQRKNKLAQVIAKRTRERQSAGR